jgi:hypothetical protein
MTQEGKAISRAVSRQRTAPDGSVAGNGRDTELVVPVIP